MNLLDLGGERPSMCSMLFRQTHQLKSPFRQLQLIYQYKRQRPASKKVKNLSHNRHPQHLHTSCSSGPLFSQKKVVFLFLFCFRLKVNYLYYNFHDEEDDEEINSLRIDLDEDIRVGREVRI